MEINKEIFLKELLLQTSKQENEYFQLQKLLSSKEKELADLQKSIQELKDVKIEIQLYTLNNLKKMLSERFNYDYDKQEEKISSLEEIFK